MYFGFVALSTVDPGPIYDNKRISTTIINIIRLSFSNVAIALPRRARHLPNVLDSSRVHHHRTPRRSTSAITAISLLVPQTSDSFVSALVYENVSIE